MKNVEIFGDIKFVMAAVQFGYFVFLTTKEGDFTHSWRELNFGWYMWICEAFTERKLF